MTTFFLGLYIVLYNITLGVGVELVSFKTHKSLNHKQVTLFVVIYSPFPSFQHIFS
jgi:hypothetical protein